MNSQNTHLKMQPPERANCWKRSQLSGKQLARVTKINRQQEQIACATASLDNGYTYNVSIAYSNPEGTAAETEIGNLVLDTPEKSLVRDWTLQP